MAEVLRHQVDLPRARALQLGGLPHQLLERPGAVRAAHQRDRAEGAGVVAPLADLEIADVRGLAEVVAHAGVTRLARVQETVPDQPRHQARQVLEGEEVVHLGQLGLELVAVARDEAADGDHRAAAAALLEARGLEQRLDGLALGGVDEAAGVDEDDVGGVEGGGDLRPVPDESRDEVLGIHRRLVAAERDDAELQPR